ncbi:MAG TPA: hypothetical protein PKY82_13170 [Pyrinomonadaceae bacterium]|nr:hypothetical protein [Pyrinomonadaceae bacterium]
MKFLGCLAIIFCFFNNYLAQSGIADRYPQRNNYFDYANVLYRKPTEKELKLVEVDAELIEEYKEFLANDKMGIFRLMPDFGCNDNKNIIVAKEECQKYSMPGTGSAYSFRKNTYRLWRLADLTYKNGVFFSGSKYTQGIIGVLGDVGLDDISLNSIGAKQLREFVPVADYKEIEQQYKKLERGVIVNGVLFSTKLKIKENTSYILRSIAYRGKSYTAVAPHITYDEFEFDKRFDILIAFRVLKMEKDGSVIILWKELERKESPKLKFPMEK